MRLNDAPGGSPMSKKDAIQILHNLFFKSNCQNCLHLYENGYECFNNYCSVAKEFNNAIESLLAEPSGDLISRADAIDVGNKIVEELSLSSIDWDDLKHWAKELFDALPSTERLYTHEEAWGMLADAVHKPDYSYEADMVRRLKEELSADRPKYNLEIIADIVQQLGHLDSYIADTYDKPKGE